MITITFPFPPIAKGRPRFGRGHAFTPLKTRRFEQDVKLWASKYVKSPMEGPLKVTLLFYLKPLKKTKKYPMSRPDLDNYIKGIFDACNEIVWHDDSQVVELHSMKYFDLTGTGKIVLSVEELG